MSDDYARRQAKRDATYAKAYTDWIAAMPPEERRKMAELGLDAPMLAPHGNGAPTGDVADSPRASVPPAPIREPEPHRPPVESIRAAAMDEATRILRHLVADILCEGNARLTLDCVSIALGLAAYQGESMTDVANRHGVTRAAVSKRCVDIVEKLGLPPSRAMKSESARRTYRRAQLQRKNR